MNGTLKGGWVGGEWSEWWGGWAAGGELNPPLGVFRLAMSLRSSSYRSKHV